MARKKYLEESEEERKGQVKGGQQQGLAGKPFPNHQFLGGGTKNEYRLHHANNSEESYDMAVGKQLSSLGLTIREMPGDGNCLFRALSDQIAGSSRNHLEYRRNVVQYMKDFRADFEPFVEDDVPFDKYVQRLSQAGTFAGNDAIVAFARLHNVSVVIHQLNSPAWVIHPSKNSEEHAGGREVHIFYHNGDHYNSVRKIGDDSESPTNIRLHSQTTSKSLAKAAGKQSPPRSASSKATSSTMTYTEQYESKRDEDYWVKDSGDIDRLVEDVMLQTNYPDPNLVRETLIDYNFDIGATIDFIISMSFEINRLQYKSESERLTNDSNTKTEKVCDNLAAAHCLPTPPRENQALSPSPPRNPVTSCEPPLKVDGGVDAERQGTAESAEIEKLGDSDEGSISSNSQPSSQDNIPRKEPKRSSRQKKEIKRRERKREADKRKATGTGHLSTASPEKENTVVISHFGSLDI